MTPSDTIGREEVCALSTAGNWRGAVMVIAQAP